MRELMRVVTPEDLRSNIEGAINDLENDLLQIFPSRTDNEREQYFFKIVDKLSKNFLLFVDDDVKELVAFCKYAYIDYPNKLKLRKTELLQQLREAVFWKQIIEEEKARNVEDLLEEKHKREIEELKKELTQERKDLIETYENEKNKINEMFDRLKDLKVETTKELKENLPEDEINNYGKDIEDGIE